MALLAMCCALLGGWWAGSPSGGRRRLRRLHPEKTARSRRAQVVEQPTARAVVCVGALALLGWLLFGVIGAVLGPPAGMALAAWIGRLETPEQARARMEIRRDLPLAADLLAACVSVGRAPEQALPIVSRAIGGSLGDRLDEVSARLALGADPLTEWTRCAQDPMLAAFARAMARSAESGAPLADGLVRLADDCRRGRRTEAQRRARSVGVKAAGPLAACFLPAFMLVGVVPTVAGSFQRLFG